MPNTEKTCVSAKPAWGASIIPLLERPEMYFHRGRFIDNLAAFLYGAGQSGPVRESLGELLELLLEEYGPNWPLELEKECGSQAVMQEWLAEHWSEYLKKKAENDTDSDGADS